MKTLAKILLVFVAAAIIGSNVSHTQPFLSYGIKANLTYSNIRVTDKVIIRGHYYSDYPLGWTANPSVSLFTQFFSQEWMTIEAELTYLAKESSHASDLTGYSIADPGQILTIHSTSGVASQFVQLNLTAHPKLDLGSTTVYAIVGPSLNWLVRTNIPYTDDELTRLVVGYDLGLGAHLGEIAGSPMLVEFKFLGDMRSFYNSYAKLWNQVWMVSVGTTL